jgi:2-oxoglutarate ferredoxin oxidoreductase subunit delta
MARIRIKTESCKGCLLCVAACPKKLIVIDERLNTRGVNPVRSKDSGECSGCCLCALVCPECCIEVYKESTRAHEHKST